LHGLQAMGVIGNAVTDTGVVVDVVEPLVVVLVVVALAARLSPAALPPGAPVPQLATTVADAKKAAPTARADRTVTLLTEPGSHVRRSERPRQK
jgi:hypothetical protein